LETIVKIARIPAGNRIGLVCRSDNFAGKVTSALAQAGLDALRIEACTTARDDVLAEFLARLDVAVVSPGRRREVEAYCNKRQHIIEFIFKPDAASVNLLRAALADVRRA
ncbi:MAG: GntR family transcriptional regulator, partial [Firmicutes bacterium]|nr:GntR family transcriptional regulator [Bacillota bacterium]